MIEQVGIFTNNKVPKLQLC